MADVSECLRLTNARREMETSKEGESEITDVRVQLSTTARIEKTKGDRGETCLKVQK